MNIINLLLYEREKYDFITHAHFS